MNPYSLAAITIERTIAPRARIYFSVPNCKYFGVNWIDSVPSEEHAKRVIEEAQNQAAAIFGSLGIALTRPVHAAPTDADHCPLTTDH